MNGIICVYKPAGYTSFDVIAIMRRLLNTKKIGHSGTLDPMAEGVLPTFVGVATKAVDFLPDSEKEYRAVFRLGMTTDTQDISGKVLTQTACCIPRKLLESVLRRYVGEIEQIPPMYSAVKVNGKRLYDLARKGVKDEDIKRESRVVTIHSLVLEQYESDLLYQEQSGGFNLPSETIGLGNYVGMIRVSCSKGTYIRTLIHDIGRELGVGAVMTGLQRTRSNGFTLEQCHSLESLRQIYACNPLELERLLLPVETLFSYPKAFLDEHQTQLFKNGVTLNADYIRLERVYDGIYSLYDSFERVIALGKIERDHSFAIIQRFNRI
jgi:tRNA pseudouridine55 synthase